MLTVGNDLRYLMTIASCKIRIEVKYSSIDSRINAQLKYFLKREANKSIEKQCNTFVNSNII